MEISAIFLKKPEDTGSYFGTDRSVAKEFRPVRTNQAVHAIAAGFQHGKGRVDQYVENSSVGYQFIV